MSTTGRVAEAEKVAVVYQAALTKLGAEMIAEALLLWRQRMPTTGGVPPAISWLREVTLLILAKRRQARTLARSYYRLHRALITGTTIPESATDQRARVTLNDLRSDFGALAGPEAPPVSVDDEVIEVDPIEGLDTDADRLDREAQREIQTALGNLGAMNLQRKLEEIDTEKPAAEVDDERQKAHDEAGARQAAAAERIALNGARSETWQTMNKDPKALGYIRLSRTGTPCGWCAMLISRGPVYRSTFTASTPEGGSFEDGDKYHDNCNCYAMPVFSKIDWETNPAYALNREYAEMWPKVTKGLGGKAALTAWRRYIRTTQKGAPEAPPTNAQEA